MIRHRIALPLLALLAAAVAGPRLAAQKQITYEDFLRRFKQARELNDKKGVAKVLKENANHAIAFFKFQVDAFAHKNDQKAGNMVEELRELWKEVWKSNLLSNIERMRQNLSRTELRVYERLVTQRQAAWRLFESAKANKRDVEFKQAIEGSQLVAESFEELGDKHQAALCYHQLLFVIEGFEKRDRGDIELQVMAMQRYLQLCEDWDWTQHNDYRINKNWEPGLKARLKDPEAGKKKAADTAAGLIPYKPGSKWATVDLSHSVMKKAMDGISVYASSNPLYWLFVFLKDGETKEMNFFNDGKIFFKQLGASKFGALVEPNGKPKPLKIGGGKKPTELWYEKDGYETNYSMFLWSGGKQEGWCGTSLNLAPQWSGGVGTALIHRRSASYFTCMVEGEKVTLYDENSNGSFGDKAGSTTLLDYRLGGGLEKALGHPMLDAMQIGKGPHTVFSPVAKVGDAWYAIRAVKNNEQVRYRMLDPEKVKSGFVVMKWKGPSKAKPKHLVLRATKGTLVDSMFDVAAHRKGVEVPVGTYEIYYGRVYNGRAPKNLDAVIFKGDSKSFEVKEGETYTLNVGVPFRIEFTPDQGPTGTTVDSTKMWVTDVSGAKWTCLTGDAVLEPELVAAKDKSGKGVKALHAWRRINGLELNDVSKNYKGKSGRILAMYPIDKKGKEFRFEKMVKNPYSGPAVIGVRQKKHRLFGKLLPVWK